jgi:hypothetical protein
MGGRAVSGAMTNRVAISKSITVQSVNGPEVTIIRGNGPAGSNAVRCVYLGTNATLSGFTLTNGATLTTGLFSKEQSGGGVWCETNALVSNCLIRGSFANEYGGGAYNGKLTNCTLSGNSSSYAGGGAYGCMLSACILSSNIATSFGGGASGSSLANCTLFGNSTVGSGGGVSEGSMTSCTLFNNSASSFGGGTRNASLTNCTLFSNSASSGGGASGGTLTSCILSNNFASSFGGGAYSANLINCTSSDNSATYGGGASGGTLTSCILSNNSASSFGGGAYSANLINCTSFDNSATYGGGASGSSLTNCTLARNTANHGGGTYGGTLRNCSLVSNSASNWGGGAYNGALTNCLLSGNSAAQYGGGAYYATMFRCELSSNSAAEGGGAYGGPLINCGLSGNSATNNGGGASYGSLINCTISCNSASNRGGGVYYATLNNCTLAGNVASSSGGGAYQGALTNCVVYFNSAPSGANYSGSTLNFCCTIPMPVSGAGNISNNPSLASLTHLAVDSPCRGQGNSNSVSGVDIDGESWRTPPSIGADEPYAASATGTLSIAISPSSATLTTGIQGQFAAQIEGRVWSNTWSFGDGTRLVNEPLASHAWADTGQYPVILMAWNADHPTGVSSTALVSVIEQVFYVNASNTTPMFPYLSWQSAATNIQDAVSAQYLLGKRLVWVMDGVYQFGGTVSGNTTNRVALTNAVTLRSVNGPAATIIRGKGQPGDATVRCAYVGSNCVFAGFTLTEGDGGVSCQNGGVVSNCWIVENTGSGAIGGTLYNCSLFRNPGGGASGATLNNCTVTGNSSGNAGGGVSNCTLNNCIVYYNTAPTSPNFSSSIMNYCCTFPNPGGTSNITTEPLLVSAMHIAASSPCIGKGSPLYASGADADGEAWRSPPSMGCDEPYATGATGQLAVAITAAFTNVPKGFQAPFAALIQGRATKIEWSFGDDTGLTNRPYVNHAWSATGQYPVVLTAWNMDHPAGVSCTTLVSVVKQAIYYVNVSNPTPFYPYATWETAATNIQDAISVYGPPGSLVLVTNGVYASGTTTNGTGTNRIVLTNSVIVRSVNGPALTIIKGGRATNENAVRCAYVDGDCVLDGFSLTNGAAERGGGIWCEIGGQVSNSWIYRNSASYGGGVHGGTLRNCKIYANFASISGGGSSLGTMGTMENCAVSNNTATYAGGGVSSGTLKNCVIYNNTVTDPYTGGGGGTLWSTLVNCTVVFNFAYDGGGVYGGTLHNCIVYNNGGSGSDFNHYLATMHYSCTTPLPVGLWNINAFPYYGSDYRLQPNSPCIDRGVNQDWMFGTTDPDGNPRVLNGRVDMGAYETPFVLNLRVILQGAYRTNLHAMIRPAAGVIPTNAPFAADPRAVATVPASAVDWVLIELRDTNGNTLVAKSGFLDTQGRVLSANGTFGIATEVSSGTYFVAVKHRNHLAVMSAQPVAFTNYVFTNDFTTGADKYYGGSNAAVELEPSVWGMIAGDADGDGEILAVDGSIYTNQLGQTGYLRGDFNLDGVVTTNDLSIWTANQGRTTAVTNGETFLSGGLTISPGRKTLLPGGSQVFTTTGTTGAVTWAMAKNPSGATLTSLTVTSAVYQAGPGSNVVDIVQAWKGNRLGRAWVNVISAAEVARVGKAIIMTGRRSADDPLWPATDYLGDFAYNTLLYRGYAKDNVRYLSPVTNQDVDGNGEQDDIALSSTLGNAANTFTNWARNPDRLFIYLVDHGGDVSGAGYFRLNASEILTATELDGWLDAIQTRYSNDVIVVLDFCEAGTFLEPLKYTGPGRRTVIAACAPNEPTYYVAGGLVSFSDSFFSGVLIGLDLKDSFLLARDAMSAYQSAWLDANGDGVYAPGADPGLLAGVDIGASFVAGKDIPQIGHVMGNQLLYGASEATLWAYDIVSGYPVDRVWCVVVPPGHNPNPTNPVGDLATLDLSYNATSGRYEATYGGFSEMGTYKLAYYARDIWESVSLPRQSYVTQNGFQERVILVVGGSTNDARWAGIDNMARLAYGTFRSRRFDKEAIYYMSPVGFEDVDHDGPNDVTALPTLANLQNAITIWASNANQLTVYLIGQGTNGLFRLNASETLSSAQLKNWLDVYQASNAQASVVMDFAGSGAFIAGLTPLPGQRRISVASSQPNQDSLFSNGGVISFSLFFLNDVFSGYDIGHAFARARDWIRQVSGQLHQQPLLDDDGNGISDKKDGLLAQGRHIGTAFRTGADAPVIGTVMPNAALNDNTAMVLWVSDVTDVEGISNVWCVTTSPDYAGIGDLPETNLTWNAVTGRYEVLWTDFTQPGTYVCTFFARDNLGELSSPQQAEVTVTNANETDGSSIQATIFSLGEIQPHNLHSSTDEDWVKFYAPTGFIFNVTARQLGANSDLQLEIYYEQTDGSIELIDWVDSYGTGSNITESLTLDLKTTSAWCLCPGTYYVRISSADTNLFGAGSEYELQIYVPIGGAGGIPFPPLSPWLPTLSVGSFYVFVGPQPLAADAGWRITQVTNEIYFSGDPVIYSLPASPNYTLSFRDVPGYRAPTNRSLVITADQITSVMAYYTYTNVSPRAESPVINTNAAFQLTFLAQAGKHYAIEESTNLLNWMPLVTNQVPPSGLLHFTKTNSTAEASAFYRARLVR